MEGLITELPQPYNQEVFDIWDELSQNLKITKAHGTTPIPHFSWHVAQSYAPETMEVLRRFLKKSPIPVVKITGLGKFHNPAPVVYLSVHATINLLKFHADMMISILPLATGSVRFYEPEQWTPHITLALGDTNPQIAGEIIARYSAKQFYWQFTPDNMILIEETPQGVFSEKESFRI